MILANIVHLSDTKPHTLQTQAYTLPSEPMCSLAKLGAADLKKRGSMFTVRLRSADRWHVADLLKCV